ncbi:hypothetical protein MBLNU230_g0168t1 [Neophaeotheca triangularis]
MLSPGALLALPACLRCQLYQAIFRPRPSATLTVGAKSCRFLHHSSRRLQDVEGAERILPDEGRAHRGEPSRHDRSYKYRHIYPNGRIIGKPGQRQREVTQSLSIESLDKPTEIVMLQDLSEDPNNAASGKRKSKAVVNDIDHGENTGGVLSAKDIEAAVQAGERPAEQDEVNASIESIRPQTTVLEQTEFDGLVGRLTRAYTAPQLSAYLDTNLGRLAAEQGEKEGRSEQIAVVSAWRVGRTSLSSRVPVRRAKGSGQKGTNKTHTARQILRLVWNVVVHTEEQALGEMEIKLEPWQVACLFDLTLEQQPLYRQLFTSDFLLRVSEIRPYRKDNVVRITARRQDAEEIARLLQIGLLHFRRSTFASSLFEAFLGNPGWPSTLAELFSDEDVRVVSDRSKALVTREPNGDMTIYGRRWSERRTAWRLLLSLLHLPSDETFSSLLPFHRASREDGSTKRDAFAMLPVSSSGLQLRLRRRNWYRFTALHKAYESAHGPEDNSDHAESDVQDDASCKDRYLEAASHLSEITPKAGNLQESHSTKRFEPEIAPQNNWELTEDGATAWRASVGRLVYHVPDSSSGRVARSKGDFISGVRATHLRTLLHNIPGMEALLTYFRQRRSYAAFETKPRLIANFVPFSADGKSTSETLTQFPRVTMSFVVKGRVDGEEIEFERVSASTRSHVVAAHCPDKAVDLQFRRGVSVTSGRKALNEPEVAAFVERLQESVRARGSLHAAPSVTFDMPNALFDQDGGMQREQGKTSKRKPKAPSANTRVRYLFAGFEQKETIDLWPDLDTKSKLSREAPKEAGLLDALSGFILRRSEINGGEFGGRRVEYELLRIPHDARGSQKTEKGDDEGQGEQKACKGDETEGQDRDVRKEHILRLSKAAFALADLVTMASSGKLRTV